jgi:hypothetical protein
VYTEPLPSTEWRGTLNLVVALHRREGYTYRHTDLWEGFTKYTVEMDSVPSFIKIGSGIQKLIEKGDSQTHRMEIA